MSTVVSVKDMDPLECAPVTRQYARAGTRRADIAVDSCVFGRFEADRKIIVSF